MSAVYLTSYYSVHCEPAVCHGWRRLSTSRTDTGNSVRATQGCLLWSPTTFSPSPPSATIWRPTYRSWTFSWVSLQNFKTKHYHETSHFLSFSNWYSLISIWETFIMPFIKQHERQSFLKLTFSIAAWHEWFDAIVWSIKIKVEYRNLLLIPACLFFRLMHYWLKL